MKSKRRSGRNKTAGRGSQPAGIAVAKLGDDPVSARGAMLLLFLLPLAMLLLDHQWIFSEPVRDPWIYYGYFLNAPSYLATFRPYYYSSRLSVILPGYVVHSLLPPIAANLVLHLSLYWAALLSLYAISRILFGGTPALLAALCVGSYPFFLYSVGQNYVDGFGITYFLLSLLGITTMTRIRRSPAVLFLVGVSAAAMLTANLFYVIYIPFLLAWYFVLHPRPALRSFLADALVVAAGTTAALAGFAFISKANGGSLLYLFSSGDFVRHLVAQRWNPFKAPIPTWLRQAVWLVFPAIVLAGALAVLFRRGGRPRDERSREAAAAQIFFLLFALLMFALQVSPYTAVLQYPFYASLLIPFAGLALAGQFALLLRTTPARSARWLLGLVAAAAVATAVVQAHGPNPLARGMPMLLALATGLTLPLAIGTGAHGFRAAALVVGGLLIGEAVIRLAPASAGAELGRNKVTLFREIDAAARAVRKVDASGNVFFWWNGNDDPRRVFDNVAATSLAGKRIVNLAFPRILEGGVMADGGRMVPHLKIVVLATKPILPQAQVALGRIGLTARLISTARIAESDRPFTMMFLELVSPRAGTGNEPAVGGERGHS